jgi:hypothetical protein
MIAGDAVDCPTDRAHYRAASDSFALRQRRRGMADLAMKDAS